MRDSHFTLSHFAPLRKWVWTLCLNNFPESTAKTCLKREFCIAKNGNTTEFMAVKLSILIEVGEKFNVL
jgi:hypothetical protein